MKTEVLPSSLDGLTLLVIDDEEYVLSATKDYLQSNYSCRIDTAGSALDALALLTKREYDAIISDYDMEEMDGIELLKNIRQKGDGTPYIIFTGKGREEVVVEAYQYGADGYVLKGGDISSQFAELAHVTSGAVEKRRTKQALFKSEAEFRFIFEEGPGAYFTLTYEGLIARCNRRAEELLGKPGKDLIGSDLSSFLIDPKMQSPFSVTRELSAGRTISNKELQIRRDGTKPTYITLSVSVTKQPDGGGTMILVSAFDDTERKEREDELRESKEFTSLVLENLPIGIAVNSVTPEVRFEFVNPSFLDIYGVTREQIQDPDSFWEVVYSDPTFREQLRVRVLADCESGDPKRMHWEDIVIGSGDKKRIISAKNIPIPDKNLMISTVWDVTDRKKVEKDLRRTKKILEGMLDGIPDIVGLQLPDNTIIRYNKAGYEALGMTPDEVRGKKCFELLGRTMPCSVCATKQAVETKKVVSLEKFVPEMQKYMSCTSSPILNDDGEVALIVELLHDATERTMKRQALVESNKKLKLLTGLTRHDVFNILQAIEFYLELARGSDNLQEKDKYITDSQLAGRRIQAILSFTREYEDFGEVGSGWQRVKPLIASAEKEIKSGEVDVIIDISEDYEVFADPIIQKVFSTLMENALRHGEKITYIRFFTELRDPDLYIICEDDGIGIPEDEKEKIFKHEYGKHTGIGLFLSREILSLTGLTIRECGTVGDGARFEIQVPRGRYKTPSMELSEQVLI